MNSITRRNMREVLPIASIFDRMLAEPFFTEAMPLAARIEEGTLALDVSEDDANVIVRASVPGFSKGDVDIEVHDNVLTINAQHTEEKEETNERYYRKERRVGSLSRRIALPSAVVDKDAQADLKDGVLTLRLPKVQKLQPKKIKIG